MQNKMFALIQMDDPTIDYLCNQDSLPGTIAAILSDSLHSLHNSTLAEVTLISSMVEMGRKLGYGIIAEGVETSEQLDILKSLDCETVQGYLFSKPVNANEISKLLSNCKLQPEERLKNARMGI